MGFIIKFLLFFVAIYLLLKSLITYLAVGNKSKRTKTYNRTQNKKANQPQTQEDRIIEYQKKRFESSEVEDADFVEIKKND